MLWTEENLKLAPPIHPEGKGKKKYIGDPAWCKSQNGRTPCGPADLYRDRIGLAGDLTSDYTSTILSNALMRGTQNSTTSKFIPGRGGGGTTCECFRYLYTVYTAGQQFF